MPTFPLVFLLRQEGIMFEQLFPLHSHTSLTIWVSVASSRTLQHLGGCEPPPIWLMANPLYRLSGCRAYIFVYNSTFISSFVSWVSSLFQGYSTLIGQFSRVRDRIFSSLSFLFFFYLRQLSGHSWVACKFPHVHARSSLEHSVAEEPLKGVALPCLSQSRDKV